MQNLLYIGLVIRELRDITKVSKFRISWVVFR